MINCIPDFVKCYFGVVILLGGQLTFFYTISEDESGNYPYCIFCV